MSNKEPQNAEGRISVCFIFFEIKNKNLRIKILKSNLRCRFGIGADAADQCGLAADGVGQLPGERSFL